jgi:hypothetical protein
VTPATLIAAATSAGVPPATVDAVAVKLLLSPAFLHHGVPSDPLRVLLRGPDLPAGPLSAATFNAVKRALQNVRPRCCPVPSVHARIPQCTIHRRHWCGLCTFLPALQTVLLPPLPPFLNHSCPRSTAAINTSLLRDTTGSCSTSHASSSCTIWSASHHTLA